MRKRMARAFGIERLKRSHRRSEPAIVDSTNLPERKISNFSLKSFASKRSQKSNKQRHEDNIDNSVGSARNSIYSERVTALTGSKTNYLNSDMEGSLSKWTNVVQGWQYRYFVLNEDSLSYYTSREKMIRGQQRGCIRLNGATIGIDGENSALFTISVDGKVFHLQGKDMKERDMWVKELERVIHMKSGIYKPRPGDQILDLNNRVKLAERQLTDLLDIVQKLETLNTQSEKAEEKRKRYLNEVLLTTRRLQNTVEHSQIILKQVQQKFHPLGGEGQNGHNAEVKPLQHNGDHEEEPPVLPPQITYSSSEDDEFFDATSGGYADSDEDTDVEDDCSDCTETDQVSTQPSSAFPTQEAAPSLNPLKSSRHHHGHHKNRRHYKQSVKSVADQGGKGEDMGGNENRNPRSRRSSSVSRKLVVKTSDEPDWGDDNEDFDAIYENTDESELGNVQQQHGSVLMHLLSQVSVGMDLTKVTLPTFILERRSLLEMYADFFTHPEDFVRSSDINTPEERFVAVVRYYLNAFYPARKSGVAKKPYNPILGETFRCRWTVPGQPNSGHKTKAGPFPGSDANQVTFIAEQVSHHPPISAFYAEHPGKKISLNAHIWTKSSFLGLSIGVANIGHATVTLHEYDEQYVVTFPNGYGRSIMGTPWVELGGKVEVRCEKTGFHAEIDFLTKPIFGGKPHRISGNLYKHGMKKPFMTLRGEWNGLMYAKRSGGEETLFIDVKAKAEVKKECEAISSQGDRESRRLWRHVTAALFRNKINIASNGKRWIEQRQRDEAKERQEKGIEHKQKYFQKVGEDSWAYQEPLGSRSAV
ncbi:unnamed protein product [Bursaphelenchus okinawaensis]|uniref:Oxysterol-binding protein n=1 Tax=Bursaphelenchus okinawaensis TaxID=465554 RepID=A0A811JX33_9BILA|nr:unnamed protein product [Bursaphelenchus okinawaensis]CAG9086766.1 unnamed protein product [Bursaphelenchus okinawaensis]